MDPRLRGDDSNLVEILTRQSLRSTTVIPAPD
jgi:hypothetical protein